MLISNNAMPGKVLCCHILRFTEKYSFVEPLEIWPASLLSQTSPLAETLVALSEIFFDDYR